MKNTEAIRAILAETEERRQELFRIGTQHEQTRYDGYIWNRLRTADPSVSRDLAQATDQNNRVRYIGIEGYVTVLEWIHLCLHYQNVCLACGQAKELGMDHVIPLSDDGAHDISNIQPLCWDCHKKKGVRRTDYR